MKKILTTFFIILIIFQINDFSMGEEISVGIYQNPPLVGMSNEGLAEGFFVDIIEYISIEEGWQMKYFIDSLSNSFKKIERNQLDLLLGIAYTEERSEKYLYNRETIYTNWGQIYSNTNLTLDSFIDLEGKVIGVEKSDVHYVSENGIKNILDDFGVDVTYREYSGRVEMLRALEKNELDAVVVSRLFGEYYESNYDIKLTPIQFNPIKIRIITGNQKNEHLLETIDEYMVKLKEDKNSIYYRYLNNLLTSDAKPLLSDDIKSFLFLLIAILVVLVAIIFASRLTIRKRNESILSKNDQLQKIINYITELNNLSDMKQLFRELVEQSKVLLSTENINIVSIIKNDGEYYLDSKEYIEGKYKKYATKNIESVNLSYINSNQLDNFQSSHLRILFFEKGLIAKFTASSGSPAFLYIETIKIIKEKSLFSIYIYNVLLNLKNIINKIERNRDQTNLFMALGELIEKRDQSVANHVQRVSEATKFLAMKCDKNYPHIDNLIIASSIHDIGKIYVPDEILNKPGRLTKEEFQIIQSHATDDFRIIDGLEKSLSKMVHNVVRYHHENWDGTGYPEGLKENKIPYEARIVSIIDVFEALTHERPYKEAWPYKKAIDFIVSQKGIKFDPEVTEIFLENSIKICNIFKKYPNKASSNERNN